MPRMADCKLKGEDSILSCAIKNRSTHSYANGLKFCINCHKRKYIDFSYL